MVDSVSFVEFTNPGIPDVSNSVGIFAGVFTKGPIDQFVFISNTTELINTFGSATDANYNDWYQAYNFLQYGNKLYVARVIDVNQSFNAGAIIDINGAIGIDILNLYIGVFDNEAQANIAVAVLLNGHTYYDVGLGDFKIYYNGQWINRGAVNIIGSEFWPNYTPIFVDSNTFKIDDFHLSLLFSVGRRLRIIEGAISKYGVISNVTENGVLPGPINTTVDVTMESGDVITNQISAVTITPSGTSWVPISTNPSGGSSIKAITSGLYSAQSVVIAVGESGLIMKSIDGGATFVSIVSNTTKRLNDVAYDYITSAFMAVGDDGVIIFSSDGGDTWTASPVNPTTPQIGKHNVLCGFGAPDGFIVGQLSSVGSTNVKIHQTNSLGTTWTSESGSHKAMVKAVYSHNEDRWLSACNASNQYYSLDPDNSWLGYTTGGSNFLAVCFIDASQGAVIAGVNGSIFKTGTGNGVTGWSASTTPSFEFTDILGLAAASSSDLIYPMVVAVGRAGKIAYSVDGGDNWTQTPNGFSPTDDINCVHFDKYNKVFIAGSNNGVICRSTNGVF